MWSDSDGERELKPNEVNPGRSSTGSEVVVMDERAMAAAADNLPNIAQLNVSQKSKVHLGPKFVSVTQNVHNAEMVKTRFLGLELISAKNTLRCSIAVFVCWALVVAVGLAFYLFKYTLPKTQTRLDLGLKETWFLRRGDWQAMPAYEVHFLTLPVSYVLIGHSATTYCDERYSCIQAVLDIQSDHLRRGWDDIGPNYLVSGDGLVFEALPLPCYMWKIIKSTSRAERLWCVAGLSTILVCIVLIIHYTKGTDPVEDVAPHEWNITRAMWLAKKYETAETTSAYDPLRLVVIQHTVSQECRLFANCAAEMRNLQAWNIRDCPCDIAYNFLIGNDGRVYEGRGWGKEGAHTHSYNRCALGIGFVGDYREEITAHSTVSALQINRTMILLQYGVESGYLHPDYRVVGAKDLQETASPGSNLYNAIRKWDHYSITFTYRHKTCDQIYFELANSSNNKSNGR